MPAQSADPSMIAVSSIILVLVIMPNRSFGRAAINKVSHRHHGNSQGGIERLAVGDRQGLRGMRNAAGSIDATAVVAASFALAQLAQGHWAFVLATIAVYVRVGVGLNILLG